MNDLTFVVLETSLAVTLMAVVVLYCFNLLRVRRTKDVPDIADNCKPEPAQPEVFNVNPQRMLRAGNKYRVDSAPARVSDLPDMDRITETQDRNFGYYPSISRMPRNPRKSFGTTTGRVSSCNSPFGTDLPVIMPLVMDYYGARVDTTDAPQADQRHPEVHCPAPEPYSFYNSSESSSSCDSSSFSSGGTD